MGTATSESCPACSFTHDGAATSCARCGVVFAKLRRGAAPVPSSDSTGTASVTREGSGAVPSSRVWATVGAALVAALVAHALPFVRVVLSPLVTLFHEFGHTVAAWILGCPALPAFDLVYGGGITHYGEFRLPIAVLVAAVWLWLGWTFRRNVRSSSLIGACAVLWIVAVSAEWRREVAIASAGHLGELILAGVLLYMALSGVGWRIPEIERPLGAFAAFFVQIQTMTFAWKLRHDAAFLAWYREGKGGALMNDLEVIALDVRIWTGLTPDVEQVAGWLAASAMVPIAAALALFVFRERVNAFARSLILLDPD